jgi:hypothetical protein
MSALSGNVRLAVSNTSGFELEATTDDGYPVHGWIVRPDPEQLCVERDRLRQVVDVERELDACAGHDR